MYQTTRRNRADLTLKNVFHFDAAAAMMPENLFDDNSCERYIKVKKAKRYAQTALVIKKSNFVTKFSALTKHNVLVSWNRISRKKKCQFNLVKSIESMYQKTIQT